jgi:hypothetical protein
MPDAQQSTQSASVLDARTSVEEILKSGDHTGTCGFLHEIWAQKYLRQFTAPCTHTRYTKCCQSCVQATDKSTKTKKKNQDEMNGAMPSLVCHRERPREVAQEIKDQGFMRSNNWTRSPCSHANQNSRTGSGTRVGHRQTRTTVLPIPS